MRIALFGRTGQVATAFRGLCTDDVLDVFDRTRADFSDPDSVASAAHETDADVLLNAVAYTAVDRAESEPDLAHRVNAVSVGRLAEVAAARGKPLLHVSTDYVFPGTGDAPWRPEDEAEPLGVYGASKLAGEVAVRAAGGRHVILRTSWVFGPHGSNFVKTMLHLSETRDRIAVVADQWGGPTEAGDIAHAMLMIASDLYRGHAGGTYHFSGAPDVSWADFAREIFHQAGRKVIVEDIATADYPTPARRPLNSRLDCTATAADFGIDRPDWRVSLADVLNELGARIAHDET